MREPKSSFYRHISPRPPWHIVQNHGALRNISDPTKMFDYPLLRGLVVAWHGTKNVVHTATIHILKPFYQRSRIIAAHADNNWHPTRHLANHQTHKVSLLLSVQRRSLPCST